MDEQKVFLVEDDETITQVISEKLTAWGLKCQLVGDFQNILQEFLQNKPAIVLLDISLPYYNGFYWCQELRKHSNVPIIFISSAAEQMNQIMAMNLGADDFIVKPFDLNVLVAKIQALLRRSYQYNQENNTPLYHLGEFVFEPEENKITNGESLVNLSPNETKIMVILLRERGQVVSKTQMVEALWQADDFIDSNTLAVNITRIRKKLASIGITDLIQTVKGKGYLIEDETKD
ncbi:response regulator transcription factor [Ligilactobacillus apodemi]|uniref:OmpR family DNA-binding response regulator n=1 Tax=Ligilactobacillus apodemi DSM 16634 = JCM 16172 TaxID=1423724 RepID=A0A0R1TZD1_9LACO|nr:response regulator transcription factor [Ligilactobacillus apodemi]KRL83954.1 OmpR family DNA-binding response regulator [Ligilactobacillus apodemi DSM 16634 = JCM 16172]MCR1900795.1 response regulator transcription factor [Ligilactobacillus apodemi]